MERQSSRGIDGTDEDRFLCYLGANNQRRWNGNGAHNLPSSIRYNRIIRPLATDKDIWASSEVILAVLVGDNQRDILKGTCRMDLQRLIGPKSDREPLLIVYEEKYTELSRQVPSLQLLTDVILAGIRVANEEQSPLRVEFLIDVDFENPSWKQIAIRVHSLEHLDYDEAQTLWKRLEDEIRPRIKEVIRDRNSDFKDSPIEISNKNIYIGMYW
jgi:hypothetical protein